VKSPAGFERKDFILLYYKSARINLAKVRHILYDMEI
jgi:hypothetical protein